MKTICLAGVLLVSCGAVCPKILCHTSLHLRVRDAQGALVNDFSVTARARETFTATCPGDSSCSRNEVILSGEATESYQVDITAGSLRFSETVTPMRTPKTGACPSCSYEPVDVTVR